MNIRQVNMSKKPMVATQRSRTLTGRLKVGGANIFRGAWEYRITETGSARLASRTGASPAFLNVLEIVQGGTVSFSLISHQLPHISSDDLELWLSAMCSMDLLAPVAPRMAIEPAGQVVPQAPPLPSAPSSTARPTHEPARPALPTVLLVHAEAKTRGAWRRALVGLEVELLDAADLETVEDLVRERCPAWIVLGLQGEDFEGLDLLRAMRRPRAPRGISRICLVVPRATVLDADAMAIAARADETATNAADIARILAEPGAAPATAGVLTGTNADAMAGQSAEKIAAVDASRELEAPPVVDSAPFAVPVANTPPVWMNLLYGNASRYGSVGTAQPCVLESRYPRLLVRMIEGWRQPGYTAEINKLIVDDRGDRHGFPPEVMEELWFLYYVHLEIFAPAEADAASRTGGQSGKSTAKSATGRENLLKTSNMITWMASHQAA